MEKENLLKYLESIKDSGDIDSLVNEINEIKKAIHDISPFKNEPVDCVLWIKNSNVVANDYNPNKVAPPEMQLLEVSIVNDGYTQPLSEAYEKFKEIKKLRKQKEELCQLV